MLMATGQKPQKLKRTESELLFINQEKNRKKTEE
jgi:hypothetical protein